MHNSIYKRFKETRHYSEIIAMKAKRLHNPKPQITPKIDIWNNKINHESTAAYL